MSLVEQLFPASELAALKQAVLAAEDQAPAAKRRKIERQGSVRSRYSADSGYNSDESTHVSKPTMPTLLPRNNSISSRSPVAPASPAASQSDEEDYCEKIAQARARLYSNASLSIPSPPASSQEAESPRNPAADTTIQDEYHSPVSVESLADTSSTSGCNLDAFISLGLAVTSHERNLLSSLTPVPRAIPAYSAAEVQARTRKLQWLQRRRAVLMEEQLRSNRLQQQQRQQQQRRTSYQGFAIPAYNDDEDDDNNNNDVDDVEKEQTVNHAAAHNQQQESEDMRQQCESPKDMATAFAEQIDDFFNIDAASEEEISIPMPIPSECGSQEGES